MWKLPFVCTGLTVMLRYLMTWTHQHFADFCFAWDLIQLTNIIFLMYIREEYISKVGFELKAGRIPKRWIKKKEKILLQCYQSNSRNATFHWPINQFTTTIHGTFTKIYLFTKVIIMYQVYFVIKRGADINFLYN